MFFQFAKIVALSVAIFLFSDEAFSAAWTLEQGKKQVIHTLSLYTTRTSFNSNGTRIRQDRFLKSEFDIYTEVGVRDDLTFGFDPHIQYLQQNDGLGGSVRNAGLSDFDIFLRNRLWTDGVSVVSLQPLLKIPGPYDKNVEPKLGNKQFYIELRGLYGRGFSLNGQNHFVDFELAYRKRMELPADEVRFDATMGYRVRQDIMFMLQSFNIFSLSSSKGGPLQLANSTDFDVSKVQLSVVKRLSERYSFQIGAFSNIRGKNTGAGGGLLFSLWTSF